MNADFYVHGVPKGQRSWGGASESDSRYIGTMYAASSESIQFIVDVHSAQKRAYYTYIRRNNVLASDNRGGSYFGITICFDGVYCTYNEGLFAFFDQLFNTFVVGNILQKQGECFRYDIDSFEQKDSILESIKVTALQKIDEFFSDRFSDIDNSFSPVAAGAIAMFNPKDVDNTAFFDTLKKALKVYISPEYQTKENLLLTLEKELQEKNVTLSKQNMLAKELSYTKSEIEALRNENQKLKSVNDKLLSELETLKFERNNQKQDVERRPISEYENNKGQKDDGLLTKLLLRVNKFFVLVALIFGVIIGFCCHKSLCVMPEIESSETIPVQFLPQRAMIPKQRPHITVDNIIQGDTLIIGETYTVRIDNIDDSIEIKWKKDGFSCIEDTQGQHVINVIAEPNSDNNGEAIISCYDKRSDTLIDRIQWPTKKQ